MFKYTDVITQAFALSLCMAIGNYLTGGEEGVYLLNLVGIWALVLTIGLNILLKKGL